MKVFDGNPCDWPNIIKGVLFTHRVSQNTSTKFSPFSFMCKQEPSLTINVKYNLADNEGNESEYLSEKESFDALFTNAISMRANMYQTTGEIICLAQEKQCYDFNQCHQVPRKIQVRKKVFLKNQRRMIRKGVINVWTIH